MDIVSLPEELSVDNNLQISLIDYKSVKEISKQQISLNSHTFSFLQKGYKEVFFDNSSFSIQNTEFLLMKSGHCLMTEKLSQKESYYASTLLFFSNDIVLNFIQKFKPLQPSGVKNKSVYSFKYDAYIKRFTDSLKDISKLPQSLQINILHSKFEEIMLYLIDRNGPDFVYSLIANSNDQTHKFIQTVENNLFNKLTLKELAFLCNMSISSFKRKFNKHYGISPIKWFQERRLELANRMVNIEGKRPSEIFHKIGYENLSSFIQAYKAKYGVTPKKDQSS